MGGVGGVVGMQTRVYFFIFDLLARLWPTFLLRLLFLARLIVRFWRCRLVQEAKWAQFLSSVFGFRFSPFRFLFCILR